MSAPSDPSPEPEPGAQAGPIAWMARNAIAANLAMVLLLVGGVFTAVTMQKEVIPEFQLDVVEIGVVYPGASPAEVEQGILLPIEEAVRGVQGVKELTSTAREGAAQILLELVSGTDRMQAFQDIDQAVDTVRTFPDDAEEPEVRLHARERDVMEVGLYGAADVWSLRKLAERLRDRLLAEPEITRVVIDNVPEYVTHVEIPQRRLREYGLTLGEVARVIEQSSRDVPGGAIDASEGEILLRMKDRKQWAEEFGEIAIITSDSGATVRLADLARITDGFDEVGFHGQFNRQPTVDLEIFRIGTQSPLEIESAVRGVLEEFETTLPSGVRLRIDSNRAEDFGERLGLLLGNGALAVVIVVVILSLFLEARLAFWIMMGMTTSFVGAIVFLPMVGVSVNMISMFGFLVALGIVVDDAIVVGENVYEYRQRGMDPLSAAIRGARDIAGPVTFSILTTIVAFVPVMFIPGITGNYWWPLPVVVIVVLAVSLLEALFILPAHLGHSPDLDDTRHGGVTGLGRRLHHVQQEFARGFSRAIEHWYRPFLGLCLRNRYVTLSAAVALLAVTGGYTASDHLGVIMMPEESADEIEAGVRLPVGTTLDQAGRVAGEITDATFRMFEKHDLARVAEGIKANVRGQNFVDVEIVMKPPDERDLTARDVIGLWRDEIGDIEGVDQITFQAERGPGGWRDDISVDLSHSDTAVLAQASRAFRERVERFEAARDVNDSYRRGKSQLDFALRPEGRLLGLTSADVGRQIRDAFYGAVALRTLRGTNEVEIRVKLPEDERRDLHHLEDFVVRAPGGAEVPLMDVAAMRSGEAFESLDRRDGRRVITVGMNVEPANAVGRVMTAIETDVLPSLRADFPGITWSFQGSQAEMRESTRALWGGFALAMGVVYALLAVAFGSYAQPLIVMLAIPFGTVGAVLGHMLLGYDVSLISFMGIVALSGVVVNDSLIMVDYANRRRDELPAFDAIHEAGRRRFRPIILTTLTTFGGLTPIILETSRQAYHLIPMAISLGFGIVFATSIILLLVPCLYMALEDLRGLAFSRPRAPAPRAA